MYLCCWGMLLLTLATCQEQNVTNAASEKATVASNEIMDVIRNPATASGELLDTAKLAKLQFIEDRYDFGEVDEGAVITHTFSFTNAGQVPLIISDVRSTCGCTVAKWPKGPILPGAAGEIPVKFDTKKKNGRQSKPITITANTYPAESIIYLDGKVFGGSDNS